MAAIPHIQEPGSPTAQAQPSTTPKSSRFRSFFGWRRTSHSPLRPSTRAGDEHSSQTTITERSTVRPSLSPRSRSANPDLATSTSQQSSDKQQSRKQDRINTDPPPLAQVQGQAILHASLETPISFVEKPRSTPTHLHARDALPQELEDSIEVKRAHKRTETTESSCNTKPKHFFLINGPYLLQYEANSEGDALPEKILALDKDTVAFACDAVPGRPWVLQVSKSNSSVAKAQGQTLRPSWSRLTLRQTEQKRMVNVLLLIFDDSEELYGWLYAVRKEIEHLGGIEYRPDIDSDDQSWRDDLARKFASASSSDAASRRSSVGRTIAPTPLPTTDGGAVRNTISRLSRRNTSASNASSKKSSTSLDRLRDSVTSDGYSSTLATSSCEPSVPSTSPTCEQFPNISSVADRPTGGLSLRSDSLNGISRSKSPHGRSLLERRKLSVHSLHISQDGQRARSILPDLPSAITGSPNSACSPVPDPDRNASLEPARRSSADGTKNNEDLQEQRAASWVSEAPKKHSKSDSMAGATKPKYSLFPTKPSPESKTDQLSPPTLTTSSIVVTDTSVAKKKKEVADQTTEPKHRKSRSRTVTLELRQHRVSALLGAGEFDMPQRSPAVTDDMIMSNFGVMRDQPPLSPMPEVKVPGLVDLKIDLDFLKGPYQQQSRKRSMVAENKRASSTKSVSSVQSDLSSAISKAPVGPPPSGPLPAVPPDSRRSSRTQRSSQYSQSSSNRHSDAVTPNRTPLSSNSKVNVVLSSPPSYDFATSDQKQRHRRTISSSLDGPPPPMRSSSRLGKNDTKSRSRSRSRARPAPIKV